jgi:uncharacterized membrane protein YeaQ/YmgE (transglycosylase-associated protein family)
MQVVFDSGNLLSSCVFYLIAGSIAGTVANFVVRGKMGCILGNFLLGILGAVVARFLLDLIVPHVPGLNNASNQLTIGFIGTTIIASIAATAIAYTFYWARVAERNQQEKLLAKHGQPPVQP